jgi:5,10-methylenetetrahydromethanopterin reductase
VVKLSGELADGLVLSNMCSPAFAGRVAVLLQAAWKSAGRSTRLVQYMPCAVNDRRGVAITAAKRMIGEMLPGFGISRRRSVPQGRECLPAPIFQKRNSLQLALGC